MFPKLGGLVQRDHFVEAMREVASSVTVVTTNGPAGRAGATVSAFSSVSADPPTILVCLNAKSRIAQTVKENGKFCVNVLAEDGGGIADRFAGKDDHRVDDRFSGINCFGALDEVPHIDGATVFHADIAQCIQSGSHLIVIGHVRDVLKGGSQPLTYKSGVYHRVVPADVQAA